MDRQGRPPVHHQLSALSSFLYLNILKIYWSITNLFPSWRAYPKWSLAKAVAFRAMERQCHLAIRYQDLVTRDIKRAPDPAELERLKAVFTWIQPWAGELSGVIGKLAEEGGIKTIQLPAYWYGDTAGFVPGTFQAGKEDRVLLFFHGGGYAVGSADPSSVFAFIPSNIAKHSKTIRLAISVEYRLSSSDPFPVANRFPTALVDAISSFHYLLSLEFRPENIYICGDSAGGNLALALARYVIEEEEKTFGGLIIASPWVDLTDSHDGPASSRTIYRNIDVLSNLSDPRGYMMCSFLGDIAPDDAYISPACQRLEVSFVNFPRTFVMWGELETFKDEIVTLCSRLEAGANTRVVRDEVPDCPHHPFMYKIMPEEQSAAIQRICEWIDAL